MANALTDKDLALIDAYWRAANYLSVGQIYLYDNPLLRKPLHQGAHQAAPARTLGHHAGPQLHLRPPQPGHQEARPRRDLHRRPRSRRARAWWPTPTSRARTARSIPTSPQDEEGMKRLFTQFSFPGGIPSHVAPETPGSIHEGGELGYALSHAYGAAFDNPDLIVACVVGDGEAETGPLATSWHSNKFLNPATDGAVLPILHLNGYKIANPSVLARISHEELDHLFRGYGYTPLLRRGRRSGADAPADGSHARHHRAGDPAASRPGAQRRPRQRPRWPMIVLRTPKGWTGPKEVDGKKTEGFWRSHQVPMGEMHENPAHVKLLEELDEELPARGALRRERPAQARARRAGAEGRAADGRQSARQRRPPAQGSRAAGLPGVRGRGARARRVDRRGRRA